ncbi:MAG: hypothetical protein J7647_20390 [Cyanobacteria bacterium SBLK]|nr:hypothetical protein [Cyanobacteria bacterium SBLK]
MQYLARVQHNSASGIKLQLLARHILADNTWVVNDVSRLVHLTDEQIAECFTPKVGFLVLVELDDKDYLQEIEDVTDWLLTSLQQKDTIQDWRQELSLNQQQFTTRNLELESRRETMEQKFKKKQEELDLWETELDRREKEVKNEE